MLLAAIITLRVTSVLAQPKADVLAEERAQLRKLKRESDEALAEAKSERGRATQLYRKLRARIDDPDDDQDEDDDPDPLLDHPIVQGFAANYGLNTEKIKAGDAEEMAKMEKLLQLAAQRFGLKTTAGANDQGAQIQAPTGRNLL